MPSGAVHQVPLLGAGRHAHPRSGGCLLELVSALVEGPWTDRPAGIDTNLGVLVRTVNDLTTAEQRPALGQLIPWLADLTEHGDRPGPELIITSTLRAALPLVSLHKDRSALLAAAPGHFDNAQMPDVRIRRCRYLRHRQAPRFMKLAARTVAADGGDPKLRQLLISTLAHVRLRNGSPPMPPTDRPAKTCRIAVPVTSEMRAPGGDIMYFHCTALIENWPRWLQPNPGPAGA